MMSTVLVIAFIILGSVHAQRSIKPLFPPENIKPYPPINGGIGGGPIQQGPTKYPMDRGMYGGAGIVGRVSYNDMGDIGRGGDRGGGAFLGRPDFVNDGGPSDFPMERVTTHTRTTKHYQPDVDNGSINGGVGGPSIQPQPVRPRPQPYPVPYPVPMPQPVPEPRTETVRVPYPVRVPVPVRIPQPIRIPVPHPVQIRVPQPYPVKIPQPYPVPVKNDVNSGNQVSGGIAAGGIAGGPQYSEIDRCAQMYGHRACYDNYGMDYDYGFGYDRYIHRRRGGMGGMFGLWMARELADGLDMGYPDFGEMGYLAMLGRGRIGGWGRRGGGFNMFGGRYGGGFGGGFGAGGFGAGRFGAGGIGGQMGYGGGWGGMFGTIRRRGRGRGGKNGGGSGGDGEGGSSGGGGSGGYYWDYSDNDD